MEQLISVNTAALLVGVSTRYIRKLVTSNKLRTQETHGVGGKSGKQHMVFLVDLPDEAQKRHAMMLDSRDNSGFDRDGFIENKGKEAEADLMKRLDIVRQCKALIDSKPKGLTEKIEQLAKDNGISQSTLRNWVKKYDNGGLGEIVRVGRSDKGKARNICLWAQKMVEERVCQKNQPTNRAVYNELIKNAEELGSKACLNCPYNPNSARRVELLRSGVLSEEIACTAPSKVGLIVPQHYCTVDRFIKDMNKGLKAFARLGNSAWEKGYMPKIRREKPSQVNAVWFGDHHQFDVIVSYNGKPVRPWLTAWLDARSNCLIGTTICIKPNTQTILKALDSGISKKVNSPFYGLPEMLYIDNGKDYRSKKLEGVEYRKLQEDEIGKLNIDLDDDHGMLKALGIGVIHALPYRAWSKTIERVFGTIERRFIQGILPGWCGHNPVVRPESLNRDIKDGNILTYEQFCEYFYKEVLPEYHAIKNKDGLSPLEIYNASEKAREGKTVSRALMASFKLSKEKRRITPEGIRLRGEMYMDDGLIAYIGENVEIRFDSEADETISVYRNGRYFLEAAKQAKFKLVGEDEDKIAAHMARQRNALKGIKQIIKNNKEIARIENGRASEALDTSWQASVVSIKHINEEASRLAEKERIKAEKDYKEALKERDYSKIRDFFIKKGLETFEQIG